MNFLNVYSASKLSGLRADGLLGLSPSTNRRGSQTNEKVHLLVTELKKDGVIDKAMFAVFLGEYYRKSKSTVRFGGYDQNIIEESKKEIEKQG